MTEKIDLQILEEQIETLVQLCQKLAQENKQLRENQAGLIAERADLVEKNALACSRIEIMIDRLKAMETDIANTSS
jgi:cell division protein ZapB